MRPDIVLIYKKDKSILVLTALYGGYFITLILPPNTGPNDNGQC
nr:hypothetical protein [uncultured Treponema sp.]